MPIFKIIKIKVIKINEEEDQLLIISIKISNKIIILNSF